MKYLEISIEDIMNIGMRNDTFEWLYLHRMGLDKSLIRQILAYTDEQYGLGSLEEFDQALADE